MKSAESLYALTSKAMLVLEQAGDAEAAGVLGRLSVGLQEPERWTISGRAVDAYLAVLMAPADLILRLRSDSPLRDRLRAALAASFDTADRVLRDVTVVLDDAGTQVDALAGAAHPYRSAPDHNALPHPGLLREAAETLAREAGAAEAAQVLGRSRLVAESAAGTVRVCVLASLKDLAILAGRRPLREEIITAVRAVVQGPRRTAGDVTFGPDWLGMQPRAVQTFAEVVRDLLAARGMGSVVVHSDASHVRLVVSDGGKVGVVDIGDADSKDAVARVKIDRDAPDPGEAARTIEKAMR
jgi:hypothetical protein